MFVKAITVFSVQCIIQTVAFFPEQPNNNLLVVQIFLLLISEGVMILDCFHGKHISLVFSGQFLDTLSECVQDNPSNCSLF